MCVFSCHGPCAPKEKWHRKEHIIIIIVIIIIIIVAVPAWRCHITQPVFVVVVVDTFVLYHYRNGASSLNGFVCSYTSMEKRKKERMEKHMAQTVLLATFVLYHYRNGANFSYGFIRFHTGVKKPHGADRSFGHIRSLSLP